MTRSKEEAAALDAALARGDRLLAALRKIAEGNFMPMALFDRLEAIEKLARETVKAEERRL